MRENFQIVKEKICIENVAQHLLGQPVRGMYFFPSEKTASIKIYPATQSFYDFGRGVGGDSVRLWSHVRAVDNWQSLREISAVFGISTALNETDRENVVAKIKAQETAQKEREQEQKCARMQWIEQVDRLKAQEELCNNLLESPHIKPFSEVWCWLVNLRQRASYRLDCLCGIE